MADFTKIRMAPLWQNCMEGQINLTDAINRRIDFVNEEGSLPIAMKIWLMLIVRPRGLHLEEKNIAINGEKASGS